MSTEIWTCELCETTNPDWEELCEVCESPKPKEKPRRKKREKKVVEPFVDPDVSGAAQLPAVWEVPGMINAPVYKLIKARSWLGIKEFLQDRSTKFKTALFQVVVFAAWMSVFMWDKSLIVLGAGYLTSFLANYFVKHAKGGSLYRYLFVTPPRLKIGFKSIDRVVTRMETAHKRPVRSLSFVPGTDILLSAARDHRVCMWDLKMGGKIKAYTKQSRRFSRVFVLREQVISVSETNVRRYNAEYKLIQTLMLKKGTMFSFIGITGDNEYLIALNEYGRIVIWELTYHHLTNPWPVKDQVVFEETDRPTCFDLSELDYDAIVGTRKGRIWKVTIPDGRRQALESLSSAVIAVKISPERVGVLGGWIAALRSGEIVTFDPRLGLMGELRTVYQNKDSSSQLNCLEFGRTFEEIIIGKTNGAILQYDCKEKKVVQSFPSKLERVNVLKVSSDGNWLAAGGHPGNVAMWRL